jgi:hypothetical protein
MGILGQGILSRSAIDILKCFSQAVTVEAEIGCNVAV